MSEDDPQCWSEMCDLQEGTQFILNDIRQTHKGDCHLPNIIKDAVLPEAVEEFFEALMGWGTDSQQFQMEEWLEQLGRARAEYYVSGPNANSWRNA